VVQQARNNKIGPIIIDKQMKFEERIKIINQNVQGLKGQTKKKKVLEWARKKNFDIMTIQEAHIEKNDLKSWTDVWKGNILYSCGSNKSRGVVMLIKENLEHDVIENISDKNGRWLIATLKLKGVTLTVASYYGPNEDDPQHLKDMINELHRIQPEKLIITGDFNLVLNINMDKMGGLPRTNHKCQSELKTWMEDQDMSDIWRVKNPNKRVYTWISKTHHKVMSRLDFILLSDSLQTTYLDSNIVPGYMSDHACTTLTLRVPDGERGRGFWKYNNKLSEHQVLKEQVRETIDTTIEENGEIDDCLLWDLLKCKIRGTCIGFAAKINKEKKSRLCQLEKDIQILEEQLQGHIALKENIEITRTEESLQKKQIERDRLISEKVEGDALRCKIAWHEEGHKASKMFLNLEKSKGEAKTIRTLKSNDGKITTGIKNILNMEEEFYEPYEQRNRKRYMENKW
jgi:exonuclease III